MVAERSVYF